MKEKKSATVRIVMNSADKSIEAEPMLKENKCETNSTHSERSSMRNNAHPRVTMMKVSAIRGIR